MRDREDETWPFLHVIAGAELSSILVNTPASDGNRYWSAEKGTDLSDAEILFVDLFDWDSQAFRDLALVMALVVASPKHPGTTGRSILVERNSVTIVVDQPDEDLTAPVAYQPGRRRISRSSQAVRTRR